MPLKSWNSFWVMLKITEWSKITGDSWWFNSWQPSKFHFNSAKLQRVDTTGWQGGAWSLQSFAFSEPAPVFPIDPLFAILEMVYPPGQCSVVRQRVCLSFWKWKKGNCKRIRKETLSTPQPITSTSQTKQWKEWLEMEAEDREMGSLKTSVLV